MCDLTSCLRLIACPLPSKCLSSPSNAFGKQ
nr:MAG TPA: hypothetical protein [Caudoviricetes sp.]